MNFLKKNYEKVILLALFIIFALLLIHLYSIVQATSEVKDSDLQIPTREPDYKVADVKSDDFNFSVLFERNTVWTKAYPRDSKTNKDFSDLLEVFKISRCGHCQYLIPRRIMEESGACPNCKKTLLPPKKEQTGAQLAARLDSDEDGIPNVNELEYDLNPYDAHDALDDLDEDGFVNVYEFQHKTDLKDPKSHPSMYTGLYISSIERQPLKVKLLGVSALEGRAKELWDIQILIQEQVIRRKKVKESKAYLAIGGTLRLDSGTYTVDDIIGQQVEKMVEGKLQKVMDYHVIIKDRKNRKITMKVDEITYDPEDKAIFKDVWSDKVYEGKVGGRIRMGSSKIGVSNYTVKAIDKRTNSVTFEPVSKDQEPFVIKRKAMMPEEFIPSREKKEKVEEDVNKNTAVVANEQRQ